MPGLEGKTFGRYELRRLVGRGGMADVYEGYDPHFERVVAIKVFKREDEEMLRRFIREAHLMASLRNKHLVPVYDAGQKELGDITWYYIVMPFMEGGTLRARIRRSPLSLEEACRDLGDIASALDYIHRQGIVHRDIKSSNVLLDAEGRCYLSDFGIARTATDVTQMTTTGNVLGTVDYVAPELFEVGRKADARSDLYSLGVLLFEMVTGQLPFSAENQIALVSMHMNNPPPPPSSMSRNISPQVERVIFKALEKKPELRYDSATALATAFCNAVASNKSALDAPMQELPEVVASRPAPHQLVLPPVLPNAPRSPQVRPSPLASWTETSPYAPSHPLAPAANLPRESARAAAPSTPARSARRRTWIVAILAALTLLLVIVPSAYVLITHSHAGNISGNNPASETQQAKAGNTPALSPTATPNLTATAQANIAATATAQAHATATAIANATATVEAQASATAGVIQTATAGKPVYQDLLNNANNPATQAAQWDENSNCSFQPDGYHVTETGYPYLHGCRETGNTYQNATISVDLSIISGHSGGLFFRLNTDLFNDFSGYLFEIDSHGNYKLSTDNGGTITPLPGHDWTQAPALKPGNTVKNTLQVIMSGNTFLFYANGTFLAQVTDSTFSGAGEVGFLATTQSQGPNADVVYSNLKVYPHS